MLLHWTMKGSLMSSCCRVIALALIASAPEFATAELTYVTQWGGYGVGPAQFNYPTGIALGPNGHVYVTDGGNNRVSRFTPDGEFVDTIGGFGNGPGQFNRPDHLHFSPTNGDLYITDLNNHRVQRFTPDGDFVLMWGSFGNGPGQFAGPWGIHVDSSGSVWVVSQGQKRIQKFTENGAS
jgi:DNA-binding beta-propeller fold protein YncE